MNRRGFFGLIAAAPLAALVPSKRTTPVMPAGAYEAIRLDVLKLKRALEDHPRRITIALRNARAFEP